MYRAFSVVCAIIACGLLGWAGYTAIYPPAEPATEGDTEPTTGT